MSMPLIKRNCYQTLGKYVEFEAGNRGGLQPPCLSLLAYVVPAQQELTLR